MLNKQEAQSLILETTSSLSLSKISKGIHSLMEKFNLTSLPSRAQPFTVTILINT